MSTGYLVNFVNRFVEGFKKFDFIFQRQLWCKSMSRLLTEECLKCWQSQFPAAREALSAAEGRAQGRGDQHRSTAGPWEAWPSFSEMYRMTSFCRPDAATRGAPQHWFPALMFRPSICLFVRQFVCLPICLYMYPRCEIIIKATWAKLRWVGPTQHHDVQGVEPAFVFRLKLRFIPDCTCSGNTY